MTILNATITAGPFKGWPLGASVAITAGQTPSAIKAAMIKDCEKRKAEIDADIESIRKLPDQIVLT